MNSTFKKILKIGLPFLLAICFGWYTFTQLPVKEILPYFKSANYWWILLGMFFGLLSHLSRAYRWKYLLEPMGYTLRFPNSIMGVFITYLANYGIPRSGEVLRAAVLTNYENVPFEKSFGTIVAERMADLIVMLGIIGFTLIIQFDYIYELLSQSIDPKKLILIAILGIVAFVLIFIILKRSKSKIALKIKGFLSGLIEGVLSIFKLKNKWTFIFHTLFIWAMYVLMFYLTTLALPDLDNITIGAVLVAFIAASFTIAATNGGIFVYPVAVMKAFMVFGIASVPSLAFGWIMWTSQTVMIIIFGTLSFIFLPIYNRKK
ncbi:MAG: lysylphosphatidylglycerol synthase transmembrane domain-containing protein [Lacinutrix sp.]|uniref:lysylphosphatidylglycerol synthase transmembrane domain-containing protein n=1 Tax=Lacinutrix sp. TaxID=1937692 RepID=UPI0030A47BB7